MTDELSTCPIIGTVLIFGGSYCSFLLLHYFSYYTYCSNIGDHVVNFYYCTFLPIIGTVLKNQACNIYEYWSYNRSLIVSHGFSFHFEHRLAGWKTLRPTFLLILEIFALSLKVLQFCNFTLGCTSKGNNQKTFAEHLLFFLAFLAFDKPFTN